MTQQIIDFGDGPNTPSGDTAYSAFTKVNENFTELYAGAGVNIGSTPTSGGAAGQIMFDSGSVVQEDSTLRFNSTSKKLTANSFGLQGNISAASWTTNGIRYANSTATLTDTTSSGSVSVAYSDTFSNSTIAASNTTFFTNYATMFIGVPTAGTNVTIGNSFSLFTGGNVKIATASYNSLQLSGAIAGNSPVLAAVGNDSNVGLTIASQTAGSITFVNNNAGTNVPQFRVNGNIFATSNLFTSGHNGANPYLASESSTLTNVNMYFYSKGSGFFQYVHGNNTTPSFIIQGPASTSITNYPIIYSALTGNAVTLNANGLDSNVSFALTTKGTGAIDLAAGSGGINISNGTTITSLVRTTAGSGYTTPPTWTASAPTTPSGVTASGSVNSIGVVTATVSSGGSGYTVGDVLTVSGGTQTTAATLTVATVSGGVITTVNITNAGAYTASPTNPASVTGGTGTLATFTLSFGINNSFTITTAGSGYVETPTITFSGGAGSSAAALAVVGSAATIKGLGGNVSASLNFATVGGTAFQIQDRGGLSDSPSLIFRPGLSGIVGPTLTFSVSPIIQCGDASSIAFRTNAGVSGAIGGQQQFAISHTASAVNYWSFTGAATTAYPTAAAAGTDTNIGLLFATKGGGLHLFRTQGSGGPTQFAIGNTTSAVNYVQATGAITTAAPSLTATGTDTNINLNLTPKGTGAVNITNGNLQLNGSPLAKTNIVTFTSSGTYTPTAGCVAISVLVVGGGGGGGFGGSYAAAAGGSGGGGGGGAAAWFQTFRASDISGTLSITIGAGGAGGQSGVTPTGGSIAGQGARGGISSFGTYLYAGGGGGGAPGAATTASGGGSGGLVANVNGGFGTNAAGGANVLFVGGGGFGSSGSFSGTSYGGGGGGTSAAGLGFTGGLNASSPSGGASGGGFNASGVAQSGANAQTIILATGSAGYVGGGAAGTSGVAAIAGSAGSAISYPYFGPYISTGGAGGGAGFGTAGTGGNGAVGGAGGNYGGGGGGGGAGNSTNSFVGGNGGSGAGGYVLIVEYF